jgi:hypothetical protein
MGPGVGQPLSNIIGNVALGGQPGAMGIPRTRPELIVATGVAFATANGGQLNVELQGAPDTGAAGGYQPGAWQTFVESGYMTAAQLAAQLEIARFPWVPPFPFNMRPRFLRLLFQTLAGAQFTAGTIAFATVTTDRTDYAVKYAARNYSA